MPSEFRARALLSVHVMAVSGWIAVVAGAIALDVQNWLWPASPAVQLWLQRLSAWVGWWVLLPCAVVALFTGFELARRWPYQWPLWIGLKMWLAVLLVVLAALVLTVWYNQAAYVFIARCVGLAALLTAVALSFTAPRCRAGQEVRPTWEATSPGEGLPKAGRGKHRARR